MVYDQFDKKIIKPIYLSPCVNTFLNLFFRHNNLLWAILNAKMKGNKLVFGTKIVFRDCKFEIYGTGNQIIIDDNCSLCGLRVYMFSEQNKLVIGKNTIINASKEQRTLFNPCEGGIFIGNNCLFSNSIELHTTDYHKILVSGQRSNIPKDIIIGSHCWIGLQTLILKGTSLADNCIVGARSLLNEEYNESNSIIAGNPARIIKGNIEWDY